MNKKYVVTLEDQEREELQEIVSVGKTQAYRIKHANILLKSDANGDSWTDEDIAAAFGCSTRTVENVRQRFVLQGMAAAIERKKREKPPTAPVLDGAGEARLTALACSAPPDGRSRWTLQLLADRCVELNIVESISPQTVMRTLKKMNSNHIAKRAG